MKQVLSLLLFLLAITLAKPQDSTQVRFPIIFFGKNSSTLTVLAKKQLDSVIIIARQYPSKSVMMVTPFGWENSKLNQLIWDRAEKVFGYLKKNKVKNQLISNTGENGMNVHSIQFELTETTVTDVEPPHPNLMKKGN